MTRQEGLGDILVQERLIAPDQLRQAKRSADRQGTPLITVLLGQGLVSEQRLVDALCRRLRMQVFDPTSTQVEQDAVRQVPFEEADRYRLLPVQVLVHGNQRVLRVAMADPLDRQAIEDIEFSTGSIVEPLIARHSQLSDAIRQHYRGVVTKLMPRSQQPVGSAAAESDRSSHGSEPRRFGGNLDDAALRTRPLQRVQNLASLDQKIDALVALLISKDIVSLAEYEEQLESMLVPPTKQEEEA